MENTDVNVLKVLHDFANMTKLANNPLFNKLSQEHRIAISLLYQKQQLLQIKSFPNFAPKEIKANLLHFSKQPVFTKILETIDPTVVEKAKANYIHEIGYMQPTNEALTLSYKKQNYLTQRYYDLLWLLNYSSQDEKPS